MTATATTKFPRLIGGAGAASMISASAALGAYYAFAVGAPHGLALGAIFAGAALGGELLKPLAVAGTVDCFRAREFARGLACMSLALVCVVYSLAAELSLAAGSRGDHASAREAAAGEAKSGREKRARAEAELQALPFARPAAELEPMIAKLKATPGANGCRAEPDGPVSRRACGEVLSLQAEAARAQRRTDLEATIAAATAQLSDGNAPAVGAADPLAAALSAYVSAAGRPISPDTLTPWLALIPVLFLELGSALSLIVVRSIGAPDARPAQREAVAVPVPCPVAAGAPLSAPDAPGEPVPAVAALPAGGADTRGPDAPKPPRRAKRTPGDGPRPPRGGKRLGTNVVDLLKARGGTIAGGQRGIADALGISKSRVNELLAELAAAGRVKLTTGRTGTRVELAAA